MKQLWLIDMMFYNFKMVVFVIISNISCLILKLWAAGKEVCVDFCININYAEILFCSINFGTISLENYMNSESICFSNICLCKDFTYLFFILSYNAITGSLDPSFLFILGDLISSRYCYYLVKKSKSMILFIFMVLICESNFATSSKWTRMLDNLLLKYIFDIP